jgi:hypothetical protein
MEREESGDFQQEFRIQGPSNEKTKEVVDGMSVLKQRGCM